MEEGFELSVSFQGKELHFPVRLLSFGYSYKLEVTIDGQLIYFEPDEERNWRAVADGDEQVKVKPALLGAIAETLEEVLR